MRTNAPCYQIYQFPIISDRGVVPPLTFLEKEAKVVSVLESLCFQGRSQRQGTLRVINGLIAYAYASHFAQKT